VVGYKHLYHAKNYQKKSLFLPKTLKNIYLWKTYLIKEGGGGYRTCLKKKGECWYTFHIPPPPCKLPPLACRSCRPAMTLQHCYGPNQARRSCAGPCVQTVFKASLWTRTASENLPPLGRPAPPLRGKIREHGSSAQECPCILNLSAMCGVIRALAPKLFFLKPQRPPMHCYA
jgi:hypothetical protein